jgi:hypothetical protein
VEAALYFRDQFRRRELRLYVRAEAFEEILFVLERLGSYLWNQGNTGEKGHGDLTKYRPSIARVADKSKTESRLSDTLMQASADRLQGGRLELRMADPFFEEGEVTEAFQASSGPPIVVLAKGPSGEPVGPVGSLTPFDLL